MRYLQLGEVHKVFVLKNYELIGFYRQLCEMYGLTITTKGGMCQWCTLFKNGWTIFYDAERSERPSIVTTWSTQLTSSYVEDGDTLLDHIVTRDEIWATQVIK